MEDHGQYLCRDGAFAADHAFHTIHQPFHFLLAQSLIFPEHQFFALAADHPRGIQVRSGSGALSEYPFHITNDPAIPVQAPELVPGGGQVGVLYHQQPWDCCELYRSDLFPVHAAPLHDRCDE